MRHIEVITHCYVLEHRHYADALVYQLSSLLYAETDHRITVSVCCHANDVLTQRVVKWAKESCPRNGVRVLSWEFNWPYLYRRCWGRNKAAKQSEADVVWYTDCDHVFTGECIDQLLWMEWPDEVTMRWPNHIQITQEHAIGDQILDHKADNPRRVDLPTESFIPKRYKRAIGGVQIVPGNYARRHGFLGGEPKWQQPAFRPHHTRDDVAHRKRCHERGIVEGIDLPGVYRIRHSEKTFCKPGV